LRFGLIADDIMAVAPDFWVGRALCCVMSWNRDNDIDFDIGICVMGEFELTRIYSHVGK